MKTYWRLLAFARPLSKYAIPYFFYTLFYALFNTCNFVMIIPLLRTLFDSGAMLEAVTSAPHFRLSVDYLTDLLNYLLYSIYGADYDTMNILILLAAFVTISALLSNTFRYLGQRTVENLRINTLQTIRNQVFDNVMGLNLSFFSSARKGDMMSRITSDVQTVRFCIVNTLQVVFREPFLIIGYIIAMVSISWQLSLFSILYLPLVALIIGSVVKKLRHPALKAQQNFGELTSVLDESLSGVKVIKAYNAEGFFRGKFRAINKKFSDISRRMMYRQQMASPMSEFMGITAVAIILVFGGMLVGKGLIGGAGFIAFIAAFSQITRPLRSFIDQFANINQGVAAGERIFDLLDTEGEVKDSPDAKEFEGLKESIELRDVRFTYDGTRDVIDGITLKINKGETVALVGASGGGKSTLSELVPRFYDVNCGEVLFDGVNVKEYKQESLRSKMSIVAQETVLFNDSIEGNILMGRPTASHDEVVEASKVANAHNFIVESPEGYDTNIGDRGAKLSGGQRQRISIARAVLKNPEILILDEATSALDTESEKLVQDALTNLLKGRTSIVIAHRLSTIYNADKIYVIDKGKVVEEGTHAELLAKEGVYAHLIAMQSFT